MENQGKTIRLQELLRDKQIIALIAGLILLFVISTIFLIMNLKKISPPSSQPANNQIKESQKQNNFPQGGNKISSISIENGPLTSPKLVQRLELDSPTNSTSHSTPPTPTLDTVAQQQLQAAVAEQQKVDQEYANWQDTTRTQFAWKKNLPYYGDGYYFYFDVTKTVFIGLLYPKPGGNIETTKSQIITAVKARGVPLDSYQTEWVVK